MTNPERRKRDPLAITAIVASFLALVVALVVGGTVLHNRASVLHIQDGRRLGIVTTCGTNQAIIAAGRMALQGGVLLPGDRLDHGRFVPGPLTRQLGPEFPSYAQRRAAAKHAADEYQRQIVKAIVKTAHDNGIAKVPVVHGMLSCDASLELGGVK